MTKYFNINKNKDYLKLTIFFFILWLICTGPIRNLDRPEEFYLKILYGSAPNFFAGITFILWITYTTSSRWVLSFLVALALLSISEFSQMFMEHQTADVNDVFASIIGCTLGALIVYYIENNNPSSE